MINAARKSRQCIEILTLLFYPAGESLKTTIERVIPYFNETVKKDMQAGKRALIVAHGNSLRALVKYFDKLSNEAIMNINIQLEFL